MRETVWFETIFYFKVSGELEMATLAKIPQNLNKR